VKAADFATLRHAIALPRRGEKTDYQFAMSLPLLDDYNPCVKYAVRKVDRAAAESESISSPLHFGAAASPAPVGLLETLLDESEPGMTAVTTLASDHDLAVARRVLATEADALGALADGLDSSFGRAVSLLFRAEGRVIVTGMGKSGHIARKIAATFASTGTPAHFVHPGEASHGDLGMILPGDAVLALSNSGETAELADLVAHSRRFGLSLIAMTARGESTLALAADVVLMLPETEEACPMGLAPTTSTTMQLALGDALAVALLTRRGFTATDYRQFHPGGRLGAKLKRVGELMRQGDALPLAPPDMVMADALLVMTEKAVGCLGVVDQDGVLTGIITDGDLRRAMGPGLLTQSVGQVMRAAPRVVSPDLLAVEALHRMNAKGPPITSLFVVDSRSRPVGLLHIHDLLRAGVA
jgi:arabinose-5-phosphate isomerase